MMLRLSTPCAIILETFTIAVNESSDFLNGTLLTTPPFKPAAPRPGAFGPAAEPDA